MNTTFEVKGMTCGHCVNAVTQEVMAIEGVESVSVDLESGRVSVESGAALDEAAIRGAVDEAGYELVGSPTTS